MNDGQAQVARLAVARALADRRPGVLQLQLDPVIAAREGRTAGWHVVHLAGAGDRAAFLAECARAFEFPDWFGHNWDALADALTDVQHRPGTLVIWSGTGALPDDARATAVEIMTERAQEGPAPFLVLLTGARTR